MSEIEENNGNDIMIDESRVDPAPVRVVEDGGEDPVEVMRRHFALHPENTASDVRPIMDVLVPSANTPEERRRVFAAAVGGHSLSQEVEEVNKTL